MSAMTSAIDPRGTALSSSLRAYARSLCSRSSVTKSFTLDVAVRAVSSRSHPASDAASAW